MPPPLPLINKYKIVHEAADRWTLYIWEDEQSYTPGWEPIDYYSSRERAEYWMEAHNRKLVEEARIRAERARHVVTETFYGVDNPD